MAQLFSSLAATVLFFSEASDVLIVRVSHGPIDLPRHAGMDLGGGGPTSGPEQEADPNTPVSKQK